MPNLARCIKQDTAPMSWAEVTQLLVNYSGYEIYGDKGRYYPNRIKQWLKYLLLQYEEASELFTRIRALRDAEAIVEQLQLTAEE